MRILLIEDHFRLADSIERGLGSVGFGIDAFPTAEDGINAYRSMNYDAVILDLGLPDRDGIDVLKELRLINSGAPILILTARDRIEDRVVGLDNGADDYLVKPFSMTELAARLRALLRRPGQALATILTVGNIKFDVGSRQLAIDGKSVTITSRELQALEVLMRCENQVVARPRLQDSLNGLGKDVSPNSLEVLISRLRRRLGAVGANCSIHTLHGIGYLLKGDIS